MYSEETDNGLILNIPEYIDHYKYIKAIGTGAYSVVILVQNTKNEDLFAVKVGSREDLTNRNHVLRFEQETRIQILYQK